MPQGPHADTQLLSARPAECRRRERLAGARARRWRVQGRPAAKKLNTIRGDLIHAHQRRIRQEFGGDALPRPRHDRRADRRLRRPAAFRRAPFPQTSHEIGWTLRLRLCLSCRRRVRLPGRPGAPCRSWPSPAMPCAHYMSRLRVRMRGQLQGQPAIRGCQFKRRHANAFNAEQGQLRSVLIRRIAKFGGCFSGGCIAGQACDGEQSSRTEKPAKFVPVEAFAQLRRSKCCRTRRALRVHQRAARRDACRQDCDRRQQACGCRRRGGRGSNGPMAISP